MPTIRPTCLIVSRVQDEHVRAVLPHLTPDTIPLVIDLSEFGRAYTSSMHVDTGICSLRIDAASGQTFDLSALQTVWWRRPQPFTIPNSENHYITSYINEEYDHYWSSVWAALPETVRWYNPVDSNRASDRKTHQLLVASQLGLKTPKTLVTSHPSDALNFINSVGRTIFKSFRGNIGAWEPTRLVDDKVIKSLESLTSCPIIFQEYLSAVADYRITFIDDDYQAVKFDITKSRYPMDVRIDTKTPAQICSIPDDIASKLRAFMNHYGIRYGAFDIRETTEGLFYFLEVNPAGQFLYLDLSYHTSLAIAMAKALSSNGDIDGQQYKTLTNENMPIAMKVTRPLALSLDHVSHIS